jgi:uncharacterized membrane protein
MHRATWILQLVLGIYFVVIGVLHFIVPSGLPEPLGWMYDLPTWLHVASGTAEIAGGLGLILPSLTRIRPALTPLAAAGLATVMLLAAAWHLSQGDPLAIVTNLVLAVLLTGIAVVRWRVHPIEPTQA